MAVEIIVWSWVWDTACMQSYLVELLTSADLLLTTPSPAWLLGKLQISSNNHRASSAEQTRLLMLPLLKDPAAPTICAAHRCLSSTDHGSDCAAGGKPTRMKIEWLLSKLKGHSKSWLFPLTDNTQPLQRYAVPWQKLVITLCKAETEKILCCGLGRPFHQVKQEGFSQGSLTMTVYCLVQTVIL